MKDIAKLSLILVVTIVALGIAIIPSHALVTLTSPANNTWTTNTTLYTLFYWDDQGPTNITNTSGNPTCQFYWYQNKTTTPTVCGELVNVVNATTYPLNSTCTIGEGESYWNVRCFNGTASEYNNTNFTITVDRTAPTVTINLPVNGVTTTTTGINWSVSATDPIDSTLTCYVWNNTDLYDTNTSITTGNWVNTTNAFNNITNANTTFKVNCSDSIGLVGNATSYIYYNATEAPAINISRDNLSYIYTSDGNVSINITPWVSYWLQNTTYKCNLSVNGGENISEYTCYNATKTQVNLTGLTNGTYNVNFSAKVVPTYGSNLTNSTGNFTFTIIRTALSVNLNTSVCPANNTYTTDTSFVISYYPTYQYANENVSCIAKLNSTVNDTWVWNSTNANSTYTSNRTINWSSIGDGTYIWNVTCTDNASQSSASTNRYITVDNTGPTIGTMQFTNTSTTTDTIVLIQFNVSDTYNNVSSCHIVVTDSNSNTVNLTGVMNSTGIVRSCNVTFTQANLTNTTEGRITITPWGIDGESNAKNGTPDGNWTFVYLYEGLTNIQADRNITFKNLGNLSTEIYYISYFNVTDSNFTTWTKGTTTFENNTLIDGEGVFVYSNSTVGILRHWTTDSVNINYTLINGCTLVSHFNETAPTYTQSCTQLTSAIDNVTEGCSPKYISFFNSSSQLYQTFKCGNTYMGGWTIPRGFSYWACTNSTGSFVSNRTE